MEAQLDDIKKMIASADIAIEITVTLTITNPMTGDEEDVRVEDLVDWVIDRCDLTPGQMVTLGAICRDVTAGGINDASDWVCETIRDVEERLTD